MELIRLPPVCHVCPSVNFFFKSNGLPQFSSDFSNIWGECAQQYCPNNCGSLFLLLILKWIFHPITLSSRTPFAVISGPLRPFSCKILPETPKHNTTGANKCKKYHGLIITALSFNKIQQKIFGFLTFLRTPHCSYFSFLLGPATFTTIWKFLVSNEVGSNKFWYAGLNI